MQKHRQPTKVNSQKIARQQISFQQSRFSAVEKCSQGAPSLSSFMQSRLIQNVKSLQSKRPFLNLVYTHIHSQNAIANMKDKNVRTLSKVTKTNRFLTILFRALLNFQSNLYSCSWASWFCIHTNRFIILDAIILFIINSTMVKIQTITHDPSSSVVRTPLAQHPFSRAREFQRAYNASKLQKIFAKPFLHSFSGHSDGISALSKCPLAINKFISGSHDGQIKIWDVTQRKCLISIYQHTQSIKGVCFNPQGSRFISSSADKTANLYDFKKAFDQEDYEHHITRDKTKMQPLTKYMSKLVLGNVDHSPKQAEFVTAGQIVQVWSYERTKPIYQLQWNVDSIFKVKYNPSEPNIICATGIDRSVILYDLRGESPIQKIYLNNKCPCVAFNPIQPMNLSVGCQDANCYTFDMRKMDSAKTIHRDHIGAVMDLDFSPTGREFVTGSFDRTVRIFGFDQGRSRQVYHAKRMQIVNSVIFSSDAHYVFSGSEDMNIRLWKSEAARPTGVVNERQKRALEYRQKLLTKFGQNRKIKRIMMHRHLPKYILNAKKRKQDQLVSKHNKRINKQANTGVKEEAIPDKVQAVDGMQLEEKSFQKKRMKKRMALREEDEEFYQQ